MEATKVKNIIIALLLAVNLFLLALVVHDRAEASRIRQQGIQDVEAAYAVSGISLCTDIPWNERAGVFGLYRDRDAEYAMIRSMLGRCAVQDLGGNILFYHSDKGEARFRGTGEFEIMPVNNSIPISGSCLDTAKNVLRDLGMRASEEGTDISEDGNLTRVTLTCQFRGNSAYNCTVEFLFSKDCLLLIDGRRPLEYEGETESDKLDTATVLMRYLAELREHGTVCSEIKSVRLGYQMTASASGEGTMLPFWCIETDVGQYFVNGITGKSENIM